MTNSILIISANAIGDTLISASAIIPLKLKFPNSKIVFVINSNSQILDPILQCDEKYVLDSKTVSQFVKIVVNLRRQKFDYAFNFFPGRLNTLFLLLAKTEVKAGFINIRKEINWHNKSQTVYVNKTSKKKFVWLSNQSFLERIALVLKSAGLDNISLIKYPIQNNVKKVQHKEFILLHPFSMMYNKSLSLTQIQELIVFLKNKFSDSIIIIGGSELINNRQFRSYAYEQNIFLKINESIQVVTSLIHNSKLFIAVDSFPIHIADSLNTNFIGIFGPTNPLSVLTNFHKSLSFNVENLQTVSAISLTDSCRKYIDNHGIIL